MMTHDIQRKTPIRTTPNGFRQPAVKFVGAFPIPTMRGGAVYMSALPIFFSEWSCPICTNIGHDVKRALEVP